MTETTAAQRPPEPDWLAMTDEELSAYRDAENRFRASEAARAFTGQPDPGATTEWRHVALDGRELPVRVYRPAPGHDSEDTDGTDRTDQTDRTDLTARTDRTALPLVLHVHGGGFVGTAVQCDWVNSHLAARLPALVVSVEHRLLAPDSPLSAAVDDGWDVLRHVIRHAARWGVDPARTVVFGESCGALITALTAIRAREAGLRLRAQVLVNPAVDVTGTMFDYASVAEHASGPGLAEPQLRLFQRLAVPPGTDARALSPLYADSLEELPPALVVVPTRDAVADHGRRYAERLEEAGTSVRLTEYPGAIHGFLSLPGVVPQAEAARTEILAFLRASLAESGEGAASR
ncbi:MULTISPECIES: alpha/beta hydrolase [unclassified Streptomyces]|uniref:alpha/beta hydrolase n=1 Tax=unclassified Streptomyces TaxID=2593676 RepID=UPI00081AFFA7|nr:MULTISPECIES: alpha/beta hydrolase [unclassified Streptomyces]MYQ87649.1 alpha/beta hydrolase fold domain-containing protein [Streptomyces sp. SID4936]SCE48851.1 acetyl esterase [Streptomyces sp. DvalAA-43]